MELQVETIIFFNHADKNGCAFATKSDQIIISDSQDLFAWNEFEEDSCAITTNRNVVSGLTWVLKKCTSDIHTKYI